MFPYISPKLGPFGPWFDGLELPELDNEPELSVSLLWLPFWSEVPELPELPNELPDELPDEPPGVVGSSQFIGASAHLRTGPNMVVEKRENRATDDHGLARIGLIKQDKIGTKELGTEE